MGRNYIDEFDFKEITSHIQDKDALEELYAYCRPNSEGLIDASDVDGILENLAYEGKDVDEAIRTSSKLQGLQPASEYKANREEPKMAEETKASEAVKPAEEVVADSKTTGGAEKKTKGIIQDTYRRIKERQKKSFAKHPYVHGAKLAGGLAGAGALAYMASRKRKNQED